MFKKMKLATKMAFGFGLLIVVSIVLAAVGWGGMISTNVKVQNAEDANWMITQAYRARMNEKDFIISSNNEHFKAAEGILADFSSKATELRDRIDDAADADQVQQVEAKIKAWLEAFRSYNALDSAKLEAEKKLIESGDTAIEMISSMRIDQKDKLLDEITIEEGEEAATAQLDRAVLGELIRLADDASTLNTLILDCRGHERNYIISKNQENIDRVKRTIKSVIDLADNMKPRFRSAGNRMQADEVILNVQAYEKAFDNYTTAVNNQEAEETRMENAASEMESLADRLHTGQKDKAAGIITSSVFMLMLFSGIGILVALASAFVITLSITRPVGKVISGLTASAQQVYSASEQVALSSQEMAEGASEQASSLEQISSSLEEMASMTRQNADNAKQASSMAEQARSNADRGAEAIHRFAEAIKSIKASSDQTAKIVKTIDEIAFQTNLLALNAAVEAARAGEAGKGFAVVAEEVRNLAQRSAEAARNTSELIAEAQQNADNGVKVSEDVAKILKQIIEGVQKVNQLVGEVSVASDEQAQGIEQVNCAVSQMDKLTQKNAANAEQTSSAGDQLTSQAIHLNQVVAELVTIVGGHKRDEEAEAEEEEAEEDHRQHFAFLRAAGEREAKPVKGELKGEVDSAKGKGKDARIVKPEHVIPLDEKELEEF